MANPRAGAITSRHVLAVEGQDEQNFFGKLLRHVGLLDVQIECVGGKDQFRNKLPALLKTSGFFQADNSSFVEHLAIIRDRDGDDAFASVAAIVRNAGLEPPRKHGEFSNGDPKVGVFIMPGEAVEGTMLEDLCLETVQDHEAMACVEQFASCVEALLAPPGNLSKAKAQVFKAHVFLAAQRETVDSVGLGAQKGYWNLDSPAPGELKAFLMQMK